MKDYKRLAVGAQLGNTPTGVLVANIVDYDGGDYELHPKIYDNGLILVDPSRPAAYGFQIQGTPEALGRLGRALLTVAKNKSDSSDEAEE